MPVLLTLVALVASLLVGAAVLRAMTGQLADGATRHPLRWLADRAEQRQAVVAARRLLPRPACDRAPEGLGPLPTSPRVVAQEAARGIRDLQLWLAEQRAA